MVSVAALAAASVLLAADSWDRHLLRLAEEAEVFGRMATKVIATETLEQVAYQPPGRFQPRGAKPQITYRTRQIVSEYGFTNFKEDPRNLHELRQVTSVDGQPVKAPAKLRETLSMGLKTDSDRLKKKLLKDFESYGLRDAATDFGQLILLFTRRQQEQYNFRFARTDQTGADRAVVLAFEQKEGDQSMTVFEGRQVMRHKLNGEVWLREEDGLPLRITLKAGRAEKTLERRYEAVVDYQASAHGVVLPAAVTYSEMSGATLMVENRFHYSDFKIFGASSEVKFTAEDPPK
ncbi:MAG: hypothetical protein HY235_23590 [Acidobacteria bacterium]|nr:hypothetical protein [Acidobacteriota bacterium]